MDSLDSIIARAAEPLETAVSLPFSAYTSEAVLEAERTEPAHEVAEALGGHGFRAQPLGDSAIEIDGRGRRVEK